MSEPGSSFALFKRTGRSRNYYCQLKDTYTGVYLPARSTGCPDKGSALLVVAAWLKDGLPPPSRSKAKKATTKGRRPIAELVEAPTLVKAIRKADLTAADAERIVSILSDRRLIDVQLKKPGPADRDFLGYLFEFWDYARSPYVKDKLAHGQRISARRCRDAARMITYHWEPYFKGRTLASISKTDLKSFSATQAGKGLACGSINKITLFGTCALVWAKENDIIAIDPTEGLRKYFTQTAKRGILTEEEIARLFTEAVWSDERARVAAMLAVTTGMRQGEIRAVQLRDIDGDTLDVYAWKEFEYCRAAPKNGEIRTVPLLPQVRTALADLAAQNPHGASPELYVFYGLRLDEPMRTDVPIDNLDAALASIGISHEARLAMHVDFHSLRHAFTTYLSRDVEAVSLKAVTGHKTDSMFQLYSAHKTTRDMKRVAEAIEAGEKPHLAGSLNEFLFGFPLESHGRCAP